MLENLKPERVQSKCKIGRFIDSLEPADAELMIAYLLDSDFSTESLVRALRERNILVVSPNVTALHRKKLCACTKLN